MPLNEGAINEILTFAPNATEEAGDLITLGEYSTHVQRLRGHQPGMALRELENRALRQTSLMAAGLAQYIANRHAEGVVDNADIDAVEAGLVAAIQAMIAAAAPSLTGYVTKAQYQQNTPIIPTATGGTANAITATYAPAITALTNGMTLMVRAASANTTTTPTFTPASGVVAAKAIVKGAGAALVAGDIAGAGHWIELQYDSTLDKWVVLNPATGVTTVSTSIGKHQIPVSAGAMVGRITGSPEPSAYETSTNKDNVRCWNFDAATVEYVQFAVPMPKSWNLGTLTAQLIWSHPAATTNFGVGWAVQAVAMGDGDAGDAAFGAAIQVNDVGGVTDAIYMTAETGAITVAGTPAAGDMVLVQVYRVATDATYDTLAVDARLIGLRLYYTTSAATDA